jgi:cytochrome b involved in lipid metabolism
MKRILIIVIALVVVFGGIFLFKNRTSAPSESDLKGVINTDTGSQGNAREVTFTMTDVAKHNSAESCYSAINGGVYDLTNWIDKHPGGSKAILSLCGKDGSDSFNGKHGGQPRPMSELANFKIGILTQE